MINRITPLITPIVISALAIAVLLFTLIGNHGLLHLSKINNELQRAQQENRQIESDIVQLNNEIYALENSPDTLELVGREQLGLSKPSEIVYIFPKSKP